MKPFRYLTIFTLCIWPLSVLRVTQNNLFTYFTPTILCVMAYLLHKKSIRIWPVFLLSTPFVDTKLLFLPVFTMFFYSLSRKPNQLRLIFLFLSLVIAFFFKNQFISQSIFSFDYQARQSLIRKTYLYPNVIFARISQNKLNIYIDKFKNNLFALVDPNNYFFAFHPREIVVTNHNLNKFPYPSFIFAIVGFYYLKKLSHHKSILIFLISSLIGLSLLDNFDLVDFIIFSPLSLIIFHGINMLKNTKPKLFFAVSLFSIFISLFEIGRLILIQ